ncbi:PTS system glucose-specific IIA component [Clostridium algifaecis]|uniref:PTS system glucose-specific IIA component n=1 Tax=Clostridium algifaecis TaxID=1472040 RepID=A0ABS4KU01_9CLOT|nr:PTS glucose transporter subunit IIA [Clostridium algifaecis]MBP2033505.1 PTS system glucose-specific IIA component [Clostridium algifaecis]
MINFLKRSFQLRAPVDGEIVDLSEVPDEIFANKIAGDGVAIKPTGDTIVAPANGMLSVIFNTNHAFGMVLENGAEIMVHIGIDTVELHGEGFERLAQQGTKVKMGDPIIKVDRNFIEGRGYSLITPMIITNLDIIKYIEYSKLNSNVKSSKDPVIFYKINKN